MLKRQNGKKRNTVLMVVSVAAVIFLCLIAKPLDVMAYDEVVIVIDPGHGGDGEDDSHRGAMYHELNEKDIDLITATALYEELSQYGNLKVYMTRTEDKAMTLEERVNYAASLGADMLVSVHYNASAHHRFYGSEIFTSAFGEEYAAGYSLASNIMNWWVEDGSVSKGIKTRIGNRGDYYGLIRIGREKSIPTIILEHGYLDNDNDFDKLSDEAAWKKMGVLDATAIADYYGAKKNVVAANVNREYVVSVPIDRVEPDTTPPTDISLTIDAYDPQSGMLTYTVSAKDSDGKLMYYDLDTEALAGDEENGFMHLSVWKDGESSMSGSYKVPDGYRGKFVARVYNAYELFTDSVPVAIPRELIPENAEDAVSAAETDGLGINDADAGAPVLETAEGEGNEAGKTGKDGTYEPTEAWDLTEELKKTKESDYTLDESQSKRSRSNYIGMIAAIVIACLMLVAIIVMAIKIGVDKNHKQKGSKRKPKDKDDYFIY